MPVELLIVLDYGVGYKYPFRRRPCHHRNAPNRTE